MSVFSCEFCCHFLSQVKFISYLSLLKLNAALISIYQYIYMQL